MPSFSILRAAFPHALQGQPSCMKKKDGAGRCRVNAHLGSASSVVYHLKKARSFHQGKRQSSIPISSGRTPWKTKRLAANASGLCMCGCGRKTKIVTKSDRRHGHVMGQPFRFIHGHSRPAEKGPNRFKLRRRTAVIFLERRDGTVLECLVSRKDFHRVRRHHWYANKNGKRASYAVAWIDGAQVQMHKHLCPNWAQVNHQNGNGLDNRRENLRGVRRAA